MSDTGFTERLRSLVGESRSERAFAREVNIPQGTLRGVLGGKSPTLETLIAIASAKGVEYRWLVTGEGPKFLGAPVSAEPASPPSTSFGASASQAMDVEYFGRVVDRISRTYRAENAQLQPLDLGRMAAEYYSATNTLVSSPDDWPEVLALIETRVRRAIRASLSDPANVKREA